MRRKKLILNVIRELRFSFKRFLTIFLITVLGSSVYIGFASVGQDMLHTSGLYYETQNLADYRILSSVGFSQEDINYLEENDAKTQVHAGYGLDVLTNGEDGAMPVRLHSLPVNKDQIMVNEPVIIDGRYPLSKTECLADIASGYAIGDVIEISEENEESSNNLLTQKSFEIVGLIIYPYYIESSQKYGNTLLGNGQLEEYFLVLESAFNSEYYLEVFLSDLATDGIDAYSDEYRRLQNEGAERITTLANERIDENYSAAVEEAEAALLSAKSEIDDGYAQLSLLQQQYDLLQSQTVGIDPSSISSSPQMLELSANISELEETLQQAENEYATKELELSQFSAPTWLVQTRQDQPYYIRYFEVVQDLETLATVFPLVFFLVAVLICLATMSRMVQEKRTEMGILKALGYNNRALSFMFISYGAVASLFGSIVGVAVGSTIIPLAIWEAYSIMYNMPELKLTVYPEIVLLSIVFNLICTIATSLIACFSEINTCCSSLMRRKAPPPGKRTIFEYVKPLWLRISFFSKLTIRNIFLYKKRTAMTIFGVMGCVALLLTGFGIGDALENVLPLQFNKIYTFNATAVLNETAMNTSKNKVQEVIEPIGEELYFSEYSIDFEYKGKSNADMIVYMFVPENPDVLSDFIRFYDPYTGNQFNLTPDDGVVITKNIASVFNVNIGDNLTLRHNNKAVDVKVAGISENYFNNYVFLTPTRYEDLFAEHAEYNRINIKINDGLDVNDTTDYLMSTDLFLGISNSEEFQNEFSSLTVGLNAVVRMLIILAVLLGVVVLYNLTYISITERTREISTLKVLGLNSFKCAKYIYKESFYLTVLGIGLGLLFGTWLIDLVIKTMVMYYLYLKPTTNPDSYIFSVLISLFLYLIVNIVSLKDIFAIKTVDSLSFNE